MTEVEVYESLREAEQVRDLLQDDLADIHDIEDQFHERGISARKLPPRGQE